MNRSYYSRKFLNAKKGVALIETSGRVGIEWIDANVTIGDCHRRIDLDFSYTNKKGRRDKLAKIALLISELQKLQKFMLNEDDVPKS